MEERKDINQAEDVRDLIEMLDKLDDTERAQVKGIIVGMNLSREVAAASA